MPTNAIIIETKYDDTIAWMWVRVSGDRVFNGQPVDVEYQGIIPLTQLQGLTNIQIRATLIAAVKAKRDASIALVPTDLGITGQVAI